MTFDHSLELQFYRKYAWACISSYKTWIMNTSIDFATCRTGTGRCCKRVCLAFLLVHNSFSKNFAYPAYADT